VQRTVKSELTPRGICQSLKQQSAGQSIAGGLDGGKACDAPNKRAAAASQRLALSIAPVQHPYAYFSCVETQVCAWLVSPAGGGSLSSTIETQVCA